MARRAAKKSGSVKVNFKDVESKTRINKEGDYPLKCIEAVSGKSSAGNEQIEFTFEVTAGEFEGAKAWFYCPLQENSLWKLHALLTAMGVEVPEEEMDIDLSELVDLEVVGVFTPDTYNGKRQYKMTDFTSMDDYEGDDKKSKSKGKKSKDDDDADRGKKSKDKGKDKGKKSKDEPEEKSKKDKSKDKGKSKDKDDGKKSKDKGKSKSKKKYDKDDIEDMDEDELQTVIDDNDLDVDLDKIKKLPKKVAAVVEALEENDLLEDD